jgi:hypothetical protein
MYIFIFIFLLKMQAEYKLLTLPEEQGINWRAMIMEGGATFTDGGGHSHMFLPLATPLDVIDYFYLACDQAYLFL